MAVEVGQNGVRVIRVTGEIDFSNAREMSEPVDAAIKDHPEGFVIDLSECTYLDSAGIAVIIHAYQRLCPKGKLVLVIANKNIEELISLIHPEHLPGMVIRGDLESAKQVLAEDTMGDS